MPIRPANRRRPTTERGGPGPPQALHSRIPPPDSDPVPRARARPLQAHTPMIDSLRDQLLNEVENVAPIPLDRLNRLLDSWQEQYHTTRHSELKEAPRERFRGAPITPVPRELIEEAFLQWAVRRVSSQGIIDFAGQKYYVDPSLAGLQLIIRFDPYNVERIFLWQEGRKLGEASAETLINKTLVRQGKPAAKIQTDASERYLHSLEQAQLRKRQQELNLIQLEDNSHE